MASAAGNTPTAQIANLDTPLAPAPDMNPHAWALANLLLAIAGVVLAVFAGILMARRKKGRTMWMVLAITLGALGVIVFLFTEDIANSMTPVDNWTIANAAIFAIGAACFGFAARQGKTETTDPTTPTEDAWGM